MFPVHELWSPFLRKLFIKHPIKYSSGPDPVLSVPPQTHVLRLLSLLPPFILCPTTDAALSTPSLTSLLLSINYILTHFLFLLNCLIYSHSFEASLIFLFSDSNLLFSRFSSKRKERHQKNLKINLQKKNQQIR